MRCLETGFQKASGRIFLLCPAHKRYRNVRCCGLRAVLAGCFPYPQEDGGFSAGRCVWKMRLNALCEDQRETQSNPDGAAQGKGAVPLWGNGKQKRSPAQTGRTLLIRRKPRQKENLLPGLSYVNKVNALYRGPESGENSPCGTAVVVSGSYRHTSMSRYMR